MEYSKRKREEEREINIEHEYWTMDEWNSISIEHISSHKKFNRFLFQNTGNFFLLFLSLSFLIHCCYSENSSALLKEKKVRPRQVYTSSNISGLLLWFKRILIYHRLMMVAGFFFHFNSHQWHFQKSGKNIHFWWALRQILWFFCFENTHILNLHLKIIPSHILIWSIYSMETVFGNVCPVILNLTSNSTLICSFLRSMAVGIDLWSLSNTPILNLKMIHQKKKYARIMVMQRGLCIV